MLHAVPRLGSRRIRTNLYVDASSEERARTEDVIFLDDETTVTLEQRWRPRTPVELSWGYQFNRRDLRFLSAETDQTVIDITGYLASLAGAMVVDRRDNMFDAKRGWLVSTTAEWGLQPLGSDFDYLRTAGTRLALPARGPADAGLERPLGRPAGLRRPAAAHGARSLLHRGRHADGARLPAGLAVGVQHRGAGRAGSPRRHQAARVQRGAALPAVLAPERRRVRGRRQHLHGREGHRPRRPGGGHGLRPAHPHAAGAGAGSISAFPCRATLARPARAGISRSAKSSSRCGQVRAGADRCGQVRAGARCDRCAGTSVRAEARRLPSTGQGANDGVFRPN